VPDNKTIKYTVTLPEESLNELKAFTKNKVIPSVNFAVREAINVYIVQTKKELYEREMKEASKDKDFINRTIESNKDFSYLDSEVGDNW